MNIANNPFQILGLPTTASAREIRRRVEELTVKLDLGLAPDELTKEKILGARQGLEDPSQRIVFELFWLLSPPDVASPSLDPGDTALVEALLHRLEQITQSDEPNASIASHDIAVLRFARFTSDPVLAVELRESLAHWGTIFDSEPFWSEMRRRALAQNDPRLVTELERIRENLPDQILSAVVETVSRAGLQDRYLANAISTVQSATGFPSSSIDATVRTIIAPVRREALAAVETLQTSLSTLQSSADMRADLRKVQTLLRDTVRPAVERLRILDPAGRDPTVADSFARQLAHLAAATAYGADDWLLGLSFMSEAIRSAQSQSVVAELAGRQAQLRRDYHVAQINDAVSRLDWVGVAAHSELAAQYADETERPEFWAGARAAHSRSKDVHFESVESRKRDIERAISLGPQGRSLTIDPQPTPILAATRPPASGHSPSPTRERKTGLWWSVGIVAVVGVLILLVMINGGGRSSDAGVAPRSTATRQLTPTPRPTATPSCRQRIEELKSDLAAAEPEIIRIQNQMSELESEIDRIASDLDRIEAQYPGGLAYAPQTTVDQYNGLVNRHNRLLAQLKQVDLQENKLVADYNKLVDEHNRLIRSC